jgi:hypothetical protein
MVLHAGAVMQQGGYSWVRCACLQPAAISASRYMNSVPVQQRRNRLSRSPPLSNSAISDPPFADVAHQAIRRQEQEMPASEV